MGTLAEFFDPYMYFCHISAWGIAQNLEGLGIFKYFNDPISIIEGKAFLLTNLSPLAGVSIISALTTIILTIIFILNLRASFAIGANAGCLSLIFWLTPGLLSIMGLSIPREALAPDVFRFAVGFTGNVGSAAINLVALLILGWSVVILFGARWKKDTVKNVYDHIWYPLGLAAALYFITDSGLPFYKEDANIQNQRQEKIVSLYKRAAQNVAHACKEGDFLKENAASLCSFQNRVSMEIATWLDIERKVRPKIHGLGWAEDLSDGSNPALLRDIDVANNWACKREGLPNLCADVPIEISINPSGGTERFLFPPASYARVLIDSETTLKRVEDRVEGIEMGHNIRYFAFLAVGFLAGGKVANATRSLLKNEITVQRSWIVALLKILHSLISGILKALQWALRSLIALLKSTSRKRAR